MLRLPKLEQALFEEEYRQYCAERRTLKHKIFYLSNSKNREVTPYILVVNNVYSDVLYTGSCGVSWLNKQEVLVELDYNTLASLKSSLRRKVKKASKLPIKNTRLNNYFIDDNIAYVIPLNTEECKMFMTPIEFSWYMNLTK